MLKQTALAAVLINAVAALAVAPAADAQTVRTKRIINTGLSLPTYVTHAPGDETRLFVLEKVGRIRIIDMTSATPTLLATSFLDINAIVDDATTTSDERGLLGLAFDPNYTKNGQFYVYYTNAGTNNVARYTRSTANPNVANATGVVMMTWSDPFSNHNGGWIDFGPDGNLYIAVGDGGSANDPNNAAQNLTSRLGKMHRIKPSIGGASPYYTIPAGNPFVGGATTDDTIWAYGLRNPWRNSFDRDTGDLWIGDVGQNAVEEIDFQLAGAAGGRNYGWRCTEGTSNTGLTGCTFGSPSLTPPIHVYNHVSGTGGGYSLTGGYVYRGCRMPELQGTYFFADYVSNNVWSFRYNAATNTKTEFTLRNSQITPSLEAGVVNQIVSFGEDANGELYIVDHGGQIYKIVPSTGDGTCAPPCAPADLDCDGTVGAADLAIMLSNWGGSGTGDLNGDNSIEASDLAILLGAWG
ncbi:MAG: PQQ-dependent sugar dehydrogenase [Planctomycetaceae bacterium]|nr:PQQ-dependent sugar dehydrogenase [Planctomycetaceae bacterium]